MRLFVILLIIVFMSNCGPNGTIFGGEVIVLDSVKLNKDDCAYLYTINRGVTGHDGPFVKISNSRQNLQQVKCAIVESPFLTEINCPNENVLIVKYYVYGENNTPKLDIEGTDNKYDIILDSSGTMMNNFHNQLDRKIKLKKR